MPATSPVICSPPFTGMSTPEPCAVARSSSTVSVRREATTSAAVLSGSPIWVPPAASLMSGVVLGLVPRLCCGSVMLHRFARLRLPLVRPGHRHGRGTLRQFGARTPYHLKRYNDEASRINAALRLILDFCPFIRQRIARRGLHISLPRPPPMPQVQGRTGSCPVMPARVLRTPEDQPVFENTTAPIIRGVRTLSYRKRSRLICLSRRLHWEYLRCMGAEDKAVRL